MRNLLELGNQYARESSWKDFALVKLCLCALGVLIGTNVAPGHRKAAAWTAVGVFLATYIPLMAKLFRLLLRDRGESAPSAEC